MALKPTVGTPMWHSRRPRPQASVDSTAADKLLGPSISAILDVISALSEQGRGLKEASPPADFILPAQSDDLVNSVQQFVEEDILNAYYVFIHPFLPIMPPPLGPIGIDQPLTMPVAPPTQHQEASSTIYTPQSPATLAVSAVLALLPHSQDDEPFGLESVQLRKAWAHHFASMALTAVEASWETDESQTNPATVLQHQPGSVKRAPIHARLPSELEPIVALLILCVYEYAQRGNCTKMRVRAGEAYALAVGMGLQNLDSEVDLCSEGRRRVWWMMYFLLSQCGVVSATSPLITFDPCFTTPLPSLASSNKAQQVLVTATQFVKDQKAALNSGTDLFSLGERMRSLDAMIQATLARPRTDDIQQPSATLVDGSEATAARCMALISQIKLQSAMIKTHRVRAFSDISLFIQKHCDLDAAEVSVPCADVSASPSSPSAGSSAKFSCCTSLDGISTHRSWDNNSSSNASPKPTVDELSERKALLLDDDVWAFTTETSSQRCLDAALAISGLIEQLPYPTPTSEATAPGATTAAGTSSLASLQSRTMPLFCCCIMQSSYALLMSYYRYRMMNQDLIGSGCASPAVERLQDDIRVSLQRNIAALQNCSNAFEAMDGMR
ncbi:hypothetical protein KEM52_000115, partial [Ascosphaera acerosa]